MNENCTGKATLIEYISGRHPRTEISLDDLQPGGAHELPLGFSATSNPQALSILNSDPFRTVLFGPLNDQGIPLPVRHGNHGACVAGLDLCASLMVLVHAGPPVWEKNPMAMMQYIKAQIGQCEPFSAPEAGPRSRAENESHIDGCSVCQPVASSMAASISAGSTAYRDSDVADMIRRAHENPAEAISFYDRKATSHSVVSVPPTKPRRKTVEVTA